MTARVVSWAVAAVAAWFLAAGVVAAGWYVWSVAVPALAGVVAS